MIIKKRPGIGVSVIITNQNKLLIGKRIGSHGANTWSFPGGHLEMFESFEEACIKETKEETNLDIKLIDKNPIIITNDFFKEENKHYVTLYFRAKALDLSKLKVMEPNKCKEWIWADWNNLPSPLFKCLENLKKLDFTPFKQ